MHKDSTVKKQRPLLTARLSAEFINLKVWLKKQRVTG